MKKSILITGRHGFIDQHCVEKFRQNGCDLILLNRKIYPDEGYPQLAISLENIAKSPISYNIDTVVHLAGVAHILTGKKIVSKTPYESINVGATLELAKKLSLKGLKRFVFVSSIAVNGPPNQSPFDDSSPSNPVTDYALSKYHAENGLKNLSVELGFELVIIRPPLVYGFKAPGNFGSLVGLVSKTPALPFGLANNLRSFISVDNLADFLFTCAHHPKAAGEKFLVTDGTYVSTKEFTNAISEGLGKKLYQLPVPISFMKLVSKFLGKEKQAEQLLGNLQVNSSKAQSLLGWSPPETMHEAMKKLHI